MLNDTESRIINFPQIADKANFSIAATDLHTIIPNQYTQLDLSKSQKSQISALQKVALDVAETNLLSNAYVLSFPEGLPHTLMELKQGGNSTTLIGADNKIAGTASLYSIQSIATVAEVFQIMSFATGQYYLANLHNDLSMINQKIDNILGFLYGDKSAELLSEITFVNDAYNNFSGIMQSDIHRLAVLTNLYESKKVAMKDIEFYINDLGKIINGPAKTYKDFESIVSNSLRIKSCLELATQLYVLSNILEVYYSKNYEPQYINSIKNSINNYIEKCDSRILSVFSNLAGRNNEFKSTPIKKVDNSDLQKTLSEIVESCSNTKNSDSRKSLVNTLDAINTPVEYLITSDGSVAYKTIDE